MGVTADGTSYLPLLVLGTTKSEQISVFTLYLLVDQVNIHFSLSRCQVWEEGRTIEKTKPITAVLPRGSCPGELCRKKQRGRLKIKHVNGRPSPGWGQLYSRQTILVPGPTSSTGSSFSLGRELESSPTRKGVGQHTMSIMDEGRTGMKVCCQEKGYSRATTACEQLERVLEWEEHHVSRGSALSRTSTTRW